MPLSFRRSFKTRPGGAIKPKKGLLTAPAGKSSRLKPAGQLRPTKHAWSIPIGCAILVGIGAFVIMARGLVPLPWQQPKAPAPAAAVTPGSDAAIAARVETLRAGTPTAPPTPSPTVVSPTVTMTAVPSATLTPSNPWSAQIPAASCIRSDLPQEGIVIGVVDGDTIRVRLQGNENVYSVRYIGVEAPQERQYYGTISTGKNAELVYYKRATLVRDITDSDEQGTLLRYVMVGGKFINFEMIAGGYAQAVSAPPDTACLSSFQAAQQKAQTNKVGLWGAPSYLIPFSPTP